MWVWNILLTGKKNNLFLKGENTQEDIADKLHIPQTTVSDKIRSFNENGNIAEIVKKLNLPSLYYTKRETALYYKHLPNQSSYYPYYTSRYRLYITGQL